MKGIGFRSSPSAVTYAVVEGHRDSYKILALEKLAVPQALQPPNQLHFVRTVLLDVMEDFGVTRAGLRVPESVALKTILARTYIEGVIQELLASSNVERYFTGQKSTLAALLGISDRNQITRWIDGLESPPFSSEWVSFAADEREAVLTACASVAGSPDEFTTAALTGVRGRK